MAAASSSTATRSTATKRISRLAASRPRVTRFVRCSTVCSRRGDAGPRDHPPRYQAGEPRLNRFGSGPRAGGRLRTRLLPTRKRPRQDGPARTLASRPKQRSRRRGPRCLLVPPEEERRSRPGIVLLGHNCAGLTRFRRYRSCRAGRAGRVARQWLAGAGAGPSRVRELVRAPTVLHPGRAGSQYMLRPVVWQFPRLRRSLPSPPRDGPNTSLARGKQCFIGCWNTSPRA